MKHSIRKTVIFIFLVLAASAALMAQSSSPAAANALAERELRAFYDAYADDLIKGQREAIANRYDPRGYFSLGNGSKQFLSFEDTRKRYLTRWNAPKSFAWRDLSFDIVSPTTASVLGLFDYQAQSGDKATYSYSASLTKQAGQWRIRVEDESFNNSPFTTKVILGDRNTQGIYKYTFTAQPYGSISAHRHSTDMKINVRSGRKFILMGDLDTAKVQVFEAGSTFVIPANTWHVEWWETETVEEIEVKSPMNTERATPATPRKN
jgi:hypothetical protein